MLECVCGFLYCAELRSKMTGDALICENAIVRVSRFRVSFEHVDYLGTAARKMN